jgi:hypothetical protein
MTWVKSDMERATNCLSNMSSFLAFEFLEGSDSHLSRVYNAICTNNAFALISVWNPDQSFQENTENTARLLLDIDQCKVKPIQLLGHLDQHESMDFDYLPPERAFFITGALNEEWLLPLCRKYRQDRIALTVGNQVKVLDGSGAVFKTFTRDLIEPHHLKRIWSAISGRNYLWLESGFLDADPFSLSAPLYGSVGLTSDIAHNLRHRGQSIGKLIRKKPFRSKEEIERARLSEIQMSASILATDLIKARDAGKSLREAKFQQQLAAFCTIHNLDFDQIVFEKLRSTAEILAINLIRARESGLATRAERCNVKLNDFCQRHQLPAEHAISTVEKRLERFGK